METSSNPVLDLSMDFSLEIIDYCELLESRKKYVLSRQLLKSGTSIGANVNEAQSPESKSDFIHKMKIADKEVRETEYWLCLCQRSRFYPDCELLLTKINVLKKNSVVHFNFIKKKIAILKDFIVTLPYYRIVIFRFDLKSLHNIIDLERE